MDRDAELDVKLDRLRRLLRSLKLDAALLRTRANFAWLTGGGRSAVNTSLDAGVAAIFVSRGELHLVTSGVEAQRLIDEQLHPDIRGRFIVLGCDWWQPGRQGEAMRMILGRGEVGVDSGEGGASIGAGVAALRASLTEAEVRRYVGDGPALAAALEVVARQVRRGASEREVAAMIARVLGELGFMIAVCLVGADERIDRYRHPTPTDRVVERRAMLTVVAERHGVYCAATRLVSLGEPDGELRRRMRAVAEVNATAIAASEPGVKWSAVLESIVGEYERQGYGDRWKDHHQGGPIGYMARDAIVTPATDGAVERPQAVAWNPTLVGVKCEDTIVTTAGGRMMLCGPGDGWPCFEIERDGKPIRCADMLVVG